MNSIELVGSALLRHIPELIAWGLGVTLAVLMVKRGGGKTENLFLSGCILMLVVAIASPWLRVWGRWLITESEGHISAHTYGLIFTPLSLLALAGLVCLIWAYLEKFHRKKQVPP